MRRFRLPLSDEGRARMRAWIEAHPQGRHGQHGYSLDQYGLDPKQLSAEDRLVEAWLDARAPVAAVTPSIHWRATS